jgi:hypothetical protein
MGHLPMNPKRSLDEYSALKMWAGVAVEQCEAVHNALDRWVDCDRRTPVRQLAEAIGRVSGASFFLASSASHIVALLDADPHMGRLPYGVHDSIRLVRNVLEHWDEWPVDKLSAKEFRDRHPGVWPFKLHLDADDFLVGGVISFLDLERALTNLNDWLWSPSPARVYPPITEPIHPYPLI